MVLYGTVQNSRKRCSTDDFIIECATQNGNIHSLSISSSLDISKDSKSNPTKFIWWLVLKYIKMTEIDMLKLKKKRHRNHIILTISYGSYHSPCNMVKLTVLGRKTYGVKNSPRNEKCSSISIFSSSHTSTVYILSRSDCTADTDRFT